MKIHNREQFQRYVGKKFYNNKKIICLVVPSLESRGGVQSVVDMLVRQIELDSDYDYLLVSLATSAADECSSSILRPSSWFSGPSIRIIPWLGRSVIHIGSYLVEFEFMRYRKRNILDSILSHCDLVQVVGGFPAWASAVIGCNKPVVVWAATLCDWERKLSMKRKGCSLKNFYSLFITLIISRLDNLAISRCEMMMVMNPLMYKYSLSLKAGDVTKVIYAPPGVDIAKYSLNKDRLSIKKGSKDSYVLSVGRFSDPRKNVDMLLEAYFMLRNSLISPPKLVLAGSSAPSGDFWKKVECYGLSNFVIFYENPNEEQLLSLYQGAVCLALSSDEEGFGMVIVEAMACGIPVIATRCGGPDSIIKDGENGYLVEVGDASGLADKLAMVCLNMHLNQKMGLNALAHVKDFFSEDVCKKIFFEIWDGLLIDKL